MKDEGKGLTDYALLFTAGTWAGLHAGAGQEITYALAAISFLAAVATGMIPAASGRKRRMREGQKTGPVRKKTVSEKPPCTFLTASPLAASARISWSLTAAG